PSKKKLTAIAAVLLVTATVSGWSSLTLADKIFLSCSGFIILPGMPQAPFSGSVTVDLDGKSVTGIVGGHIDQIQADFVTFGYFDPRAKRSAHEKIDRVTGSLSGNVSAQSGDGIGQQ